MSVHADPPPAVVREPTSKGFQYVTGDQLGKGGFAICHRAELCVEMKPTGKIVALKIVRSKMEPPKLAQKFVTELQLHSKLHHPNIVKFFRAFSFQTSTYVVLELCENGSLADAIRKRSYFTMPEIRRWLVQICGAVKYLHHRNIVHRDLKTGNLFLDSGMNIKVGDFGLAAVLVSKHDIGMRRTTMCGTPNYLAPEILEKGGRGHNEKVDLWAIGIIAYTLAVGKAPFHASKREDIYKKLQTCEYKWPDVSKTQNDISTDLRDLVSSLLVQEDDRPCPDEIVSHCFFKTKFIPDHLDSSCTSKKPHWQGIRPPSSETLRRGFSESWAKLCKESGVGIYAPGKTFPVGGSKRIVSVVKDCEREIAAGRCPIVPIPKDQIYLPFPDQVDILGNEVNQLSGIVEEQDSSTEGQQLTEISANKQSTKLAVRASKYQPRNRKENTDPLGAIVEELHAPICRKTGTWRKQEQVRAELSRQTSREEYHGVGATSSRQASREQPIEIPVPPRQTSREQRAEKQPVPVRKASREQHVEDILTSSRQTFRDRPKEGRETSSRQPSREQPDKEVPLLSRQPSRREKPVPTGSAAAAARPRQASRDKPLTLPRLISAPVLDAPTRQGFTVRAVSASEEPTAEKKPAVEIIVIPDETLPSKRTIREDQPFTDPIAVLARVSQLRDNIASALSGKISLRSHPVAQPALPFITKWVDYAKKHGVGYVMEDGSIGCLFAANNRHPVTPAIVRNGYSRLQRVGKNLENLGKVELEYYTQRAGDELRRDEVHGDRKKTTAILWAKFGRYMCQQLGEIPEQREEYPFGRNTVFVRYYQRLGPIGIWGFSNGCFQFNFPDHTKLALSADGKFCNFTALTEDAMEYLRKNGDLPMKHIKAREVLSGPVSTLLYGSNSSKELVRVTEANYLREKLLYINKVVGQWIAMGGLGCSASAQGVQRVKWNGPRLRGNAIKEEWITLGRFGGDEVLC